MVIFQRILISAVLAVGGSYITLQGMDNPAPAQVTVPCDWCNQPQTQLWVKGNHLHKYIDCFHVMCQACQTTIAGKYPQKSKEFFWCSYCEAFYKDKKKVCWKKINHLHGLPLQDTPATKLVDNHYYQSRNYSDVTPEIELPTESADGYDAIFKTEWHLKSLLAYAGVGVVIGGILYYLHSRMQTGAEEFDGDKEADQNNEMNRGKGEAV